MPPKNLAAMNSSIASRSNRAKEADPFRLLRCGDGLSAGFIHVFLLPFELNMAAFLEGKISDFCFHIHGKIWT